MKTLNILISAITVLFFCVSGFAQEAGPAPGANIYCDTFFDVLKKSQATTVDAFLYDFTRPNQAAKIYSSVTSKVLMYNSRAVHGSSLQNPRALIMYGMSDLVLAFNGAPEQRAYDMLEIMCYNRSAGEFQFRAIQFKSEQQPNSEILSEVEVENSRYRLSVANPQACKTCHNLAGSSYTRPAWQTYLAWAGAYGSYEEAYNMPSARFATEKTEYKSLMSFMQKVLDEKKPRYNRFDWGGRGMPNLATSNNAFFGILLNYKMANSALRFALQNLKQPDKQKYRYAFAGYMMNCDNNTFIDGDSESSLSNLRARMATERAQFEINERLKLAKDITEHARSDLGETDELIWKPRHIDASPIDTKAVNLYSYPEGMASMVARVSRAIPSWLIKLSRFEYLYSKMGVSTESLHLGDGNTPNAKTSWDGYNEIQDYMGDYFYKFYQLPAVTAAQQKAGEELSARQAGIAEVNRPDLVTTLSDEDYQTVLEDLKSLGLPQIQNGDKKALCRELSVESQKALDGK